MQLRAFRVGGARLPYLVTCLYTRPVNPGGSAPSHFARIWVVRGLGTKGVILGRSEPGIADICSRDVERFVRFSGRCADPAADICPDSVSSDTRSRGAVQRAVDMSEVPKYTANVLSTARRSVRYALLTDTGHCYNSFHCPSVKLDRYGSPYRRQNVVKTKAELS